MSVDRAVLKRIIDAIHFRQPDRVPIWEALQNQAVYDHCAPGVPFPQCAAIACEKLGIDATYGCINPIDPSAGMDIGVIRRKYGRRLILVGNVGRNHVLRWGTPDQARQEVRDCLAAVGPGGGHVLQCGDGQIMPDIPLGNVLAYLDEARGSGCRRERHAFYTEDHVSVAEGPKNASTLLDKNGL